MHHQDVVGRAANIELYSVGTHRVSTAERGNGVLALCTRSSPMSEHLHG
jgi:hypothetical protein